jgi:hypothetical protein
VTRTLGAAALAVTVAGLLSASEAATAPPHAGGPACNRQFSGERSCGGSTTPTDAAVAITLEPIDCFIAEFVVKRGVEIISTGRQTLDLQGSTMTVETHEIKPRGQMNSIAVWEKQTGRTSER